MLCLQIAAEASWTCCTYLGWRKNRADKKAAACVSLVEAFMPWPQLLPWWWTDRSGAGLAPLSKASSAEPQLLFGFFFFLLLVQLKLLPHKAVQEGRWWWKSSVEVQGVEFSSWTAEQSSQGSFYSTCKLTSTFTGTWMLHHTQPWKRNF